MFGIEHFSGKPNGNGTIQEFLHSNIAARIRRGNGAFSTAGGRPAQAACS
jgi:hypothetical protein